MKILNTKKITDEKWLNLFKTKAKNKGNIVEWVWASRNKEGISKKPDAVVIVPFDNKNKRLILIEEYRIPIQDYEVGFPAGLMEKNESIKEAAKRELEEETGYIVNEFLDISPPVYSSGGLSDESICFVYVNCSRGGKQNLESTECLQVMPVPYNELDTLLFSTKKISAKAWPVIYGVVDRLQSEFKNEKV